MKSGISTLRFRSVFNGLLLSILLLSALYAGHVPAAHALGTIRYAKPAGLTSGSCGSWAKACGLRYALASVAVSGDQIWVTKGTYKPTSGTDRTISFVLKNGVALYGGFAGTESSLSQRDPAVNVTILSGDIGVAAVVSDNSYHVIQASSVSSSAVLDGFTITGGNATGSRTASLAPAVGCSTTTAAQR